MKRSGSPQAKHRWRRRLGSGGQVVWTRLSSQVTGRRLVSFLVSYMFVYLRPSPSTAAL
jgi:hypothetical protein